MKILNWPIIYTFIRNYPICIGFCNKEFPLEDRQLGWVNNSNGFYYEWGKLNYGSWNVSGRNEGTIFGRDGYVNRHFLELA